MSDAKSFMQAILDCPDDDSPRLDYADWLERRGDPRSEFIRLQCRLAGMAEADEAWSELKLRERELLTAHVDEWAEPFIDHCQGCDFRRGFPSGVACWASVFLEHIPR